MPSGALRVLTWLSLMVILVLDLFVFSDHTVPILYAVPVLLASLTESSLLVVVVSILVICFELISIVVLPQSPIFWGLRLIALFIVCYLALKIAGQRALIRRTIQIEERAKWAMLIAEVAHELRTPLTVVLGYSQRLQSDPRLPDPLRRTVVTVELAAQHMRHAIDTTIERAKAGDEASTEDH
jgi:signal transduction histidine kinase